ncbi:fasciclin domain-containing protein [Flavicella sediminum]|uniref:fasciclin domain-containing protein n=1 Tax=Flavicella sediminum TaxID=2585141 RepID=UPI00111E59B7|nr:fasciclin domain-containing protein [Flavicella sediminum]
MRNRDKLYAFLLMVVTVLTLSLYSCTDKLDGQTFFTSDALTIAQKLEESPEKYSSYIEILKKTEFYNALKSYGSYTCFVPTNEAVQEYLQDTWNVSTVAELTTEEQIERLKTLVKFHIIPTKRGTSAFVEGRLVDTTYTGDYLTTSFLKGGGVANVEINREVTMDQYDIPANNGIIHSIVKVLTPFEEPITKILENTGEYTIFVEALKQTGYFDVFSVLKNESGNRNNFTILAESDEVYSQNGINSFADLVARISPDNSDFLSAENELNRFVAYHGTQNFLYSADFPEDGFINTVLPRNAIKSFKTDKELKLNETETGVDDTWTSLISEGSNFPARNGVYHTVNKILNIFTPKAKYILFDPVNDQPEVQARLVKSHQRVPSTFYEYVTWFPESDKRFLAQSKNPTVNYTVFDVGGFAYIEFVTPVLPKGKYEVTVCSNTGNSARGVFQLYWDGEPMGSVYDVRTKVAKLGYPDDEALMEINGWRRGLKTAVNNKGVAAYDTSNWVRYVVTKELLCPVQDRHVIRFETVKSGGMPLDYIEFIPVE